MDTLNNNQFQITNNKDEVSSVSEDVEQVPEGSVDVSSPEDLDETWARWRCLVCGYNYEYCYK